MNRKKLNHTLNILCVLCLAFLLASCDKKEDEPFVNVEQPTPSVSVSEGKRLIEVNNSQQEDDMKKPVVEEPVTVSDSFTASDNISEDTPTLDGQLQNGNEAASPHEAAQPKPECFVVASELGCNDGVELLCVGEYIVYAASKYPDADYLELYVLDKKGKTCAYKKMEGLTTLDYDIYKAGEDTLAFDCFLTGEITFFDMKLIELKRMKNPAPGMGSLTFDDESGFFYYVDNEKHALCRIDYIGESEPEELCTFGGIAASLYIEKPVNRTVCVRIYDKDTDGHDIIRSIAYDKQTGEVYTDDSESCMMLADKASSCVIHRCDDPFVYIKVLDPVEPDRCITLDLSDPYELMITETDFAHRVMITSCFTEQNESNVLVEYRAYSLETGKLISNHVLNICDNPFMPGIAIDPDEGILYSGYNPKGISEHGGEVCIEGWNYLSGIIHPEVESFPKYATFSRALEEERKALEDKYGIFLYIGDEILSTEFLYAMSICKDEKLIGEALDRIDKVLERFPKGFLKQLKYGKVKSLGFYLGKDFKNRKENGLADPVAFTESNGYEMSVCLDLKEIGNLEQNLYHELTHLVDHAIEVSVSFGRNTDYFDKWLALQPEGFAYSYDLKVREGKEYIFKNAKRGEAYFIDDYSLTYDIEDRARMLEYLLTEDTTTGMIAQSPYMQKKLELYFETVRETFDTDGWPSDTFWEEALKKAEGYEN